MSVSTTLGNGIGSEQFGATVHTAPATWHIALFTASPGVAGSAANEVSGGSYARVAVTNNATNFPATAALAGANGTAIAFPAPTADWGTITYFGLCASTNEGTDDVRHFGALTSPVSIVSGGGAPTFAIGAMIWSLT